MTTYARVGLDRWLIGSVADRLLHMSHVPLLLVRPFDNPTEHLPVLRRLVVAVDGSDLAESILPYAIGLAKAMQLEVTLLHCVELLPYDYGDYLGYSTELGAGASGARLLERGCGAFERGGYTCDL